MKKAIWLLPLFGLLPLTNVVAQDDPCAGEAAATEVGFNYKGSCVLADKNGPPVQSVVVERRETIGDGTRVIGILLVNTPEGWKLGPEFVTDKDVEFAEVGDSGHLLVDVTE
jgi:hypothetical protein